MEQGAVQTPRRAEVGVFDHSVLAQSRLAQPSAKPLVVARGHFAVEWQAEPVLAGEVGGSGAALHLNERIEDHSSKVASQSRSGPHSHHRLLQLFQGVAPVSAEVPLRCRFTLKEQRCIATRSDKLATSFIGFVLLGCIRIWARFVHGA